MSYFYNLYSMCDNYDNNNNISAPVVNYFARTL